jgi:tripartite-type tricarboxylate transporter receptor subunit TctC
MINTLTSRGGRCRELATLAAVLVAAALPATAQVDFSGESVRFVIASSAGGPTDTMGRSFAPFIAEHLPGSPDVIVENRPGAVGVVAANWMYNIPEPDGLTVGVTLGMVSSGLMQVEGVEFDPAGFNIIGAISATQVLLARNDLEIKEPKDLLSPAKPLILASLGAASTTDSANRLFLQMIGADYEYVTGYPGQNETLLALSQGEASIANASHNTYLSRRDAIRTEGAFDAVVQRGELDASGNFRRNPQISEIPTMVEAIEQINPDALDTVDFATYEMIVGSMALHYSFVLPPETPAEIVEAYRTAFNEAMEDPSTRETVERAIKSSYDWVGGADADAIIVKLREDFNAEPRIKERLTELMQGEN